MIKGVFRALYSMLQQLNSEDMEYLCQQRINYIKCYAYFNILVWMFVRNWFTMEIYSQLYFVLLGILSASFVFRECVSVMFSLLAAVAKLIELHFFIGYFYMKLYLALLTSVKYVITYFIILILIHILFYLFRRVL